VKRGQVNRTSGGPSSELHERRDAETKKQDKLAAAR
jgi:hypothetical protein